MKAQKPRTTPVLIAVLLFVTMIAALFYAGYVATSLAKESAMHLEEVVTQGAELVYKQNRSDMDALHIIGDSMMSNKAMTSHAKLAFMRLQADKHGFSRMGFADSEGVTTTTDGYQFMSTDYPFYKAAMEGIEYVSDPVSEISQPGQYIIMFAIPMANGKQPQGVLFGSYRTDTLMDILNVSFYGQPQSAYIIDANGNTIMYPRGGNRGENFFEAAASYNSPARMKQIRQDLSENRVGGAQLKLGKHNHFVSYAPVGINDWFLLSSVQAEVVFSRSEGVIIGTMIVILCIAVLFGIVLVYIFTLRKKASQEITTLAYYDTLTGAPNVEKFRQDARMLIHRHGAGKYLVMYIDTRHFRYFNKDFGYEAGDDYLIHMANILRETVTESETFARISGDMFLLLHRRRSDNDYGVGYWRQLRDRIMNCPIIVDSRYTLRLNCGICELSREITNIQTAIDRANLARKALKDSYDTDVMLYNAEMQHQIDREKAIERCMHAALENDEFVPYMQPKYSLENGRVVGAEALARWIKPAGDIIPPDEFIPLFEKNGFVAELDLYMLEQVCSHMRAQIDSGIVPVPTSINQSRCYMYNPDYVDTLCATVNKYRIPPHLIEFEITENIAYKSMDKLIIVIEKLNANGFHLSLDDFGSGYSSLNVLKDLKVDVLKLDRVFLGKTIDTTRGKTVVANIIRMAKELAIDVVAEGVETSEQVDFLRSSNCDMAQGFFFSRPIPMKEFEELLRQQGEPVSI